MNSIRTTAIIDSDCMELLYRLSAAKKKNRQRLLNLYLRRLLNGSIQGANGFNSSVKVSGRWREMVMIHYSISAEVYEACLDLRKFGEKIGFKNT